MAYFLKPETETWNIFWSLKPKHGIFIEALNGNMAYYLKPWMETCGIFFEAYYCQKMTQNLILELKKVSKAPKIVIIDPFGSF